MGKGISIAGRKTIFFFITMQITFVYKFIYSYSFFFPIYMLICKYLDILQTRWKSRKSVHKGLKGQFHSSAHPAH